MSYFFVNSFAFQPETIIKLRWKDFYPSNFSRRKFIMDALAA